MAMQIVAEPAFVPLLSKIQVKENISVESCAERDITRRIVAYTATRTTEELVTSAQCAPEALEDVADAALSLLTYSQAESELTRAVIARCMWVANQVSASPTQSGEGVSHG